MVALFIPPYPASTGVVRNPAWGPISTGLRRNLTVLERHFHRTSLAVVGNHFLVRLLQSIAIPQSLPTRRYFDYVDSMALTLATSLDMTSAIHAGKLFPGTFYGKGCPEVLIADSDVFDPEIAHANWEKLVPVKVLWHPISDLNLLLPDGKRSSTDEGLAVILINIPMLAIQYRAFRAREMRAHALFGYDQRSLMQFIHMFVLPNMMRSHLEVALMNRLINLQQGIPMGEATRKQPFFQSDYTSQVDKVYKDVLRSLQLVERDFTGILRNLPSATYPSMLEAMEMPDLPPTVQLAWADLIARLPVIQFLFLATEKQPRIKNGTEVNQLMRLLTNLRSNRTLEKQLPAIVYAQVVDVIKTLTTKDYKSMA